MENKKSIPSNNNPGIVIDDGSVTEYIRNKRGDVIGEFTFYPHDVGIIDRYNKAVAEFDKITAPLEYIDMKPDGTAEEGAELNALREAEQRLYEVCDYIFGGDMSKAFFGKLHPFSPVNGRFYCENALEALGKYISQRFGHEVEKVNKRVAKYTESYQPHGQKSGKHKGGKKH